MFDNRASRRYRGSRVVRSGNNTEDGQAHRRPRARGAAGCGRRRARGLWPVDGLVIQAVRQRRRPLCGRAAPRHRHRRAGRHPGACRARRVWSRSQGRARLRARVTIRTADGFAVTHAQLGSLLVDEGLVVAEGDTVGTVGTSDEPEQRAAPAPRRPGRRRRAGLRRPARAPSDAASRGSPGRRRACRRIRCRLSRHPRRKRRRRPRRRWLRSTGTAAADEQPAPQPPAAGCHLRRQRRADRRRRAGPDPPRPCVSGRPRTAPAGSDAPQRRARRTQSRVGRRARASPARRHPAARRSGRPLRDSRPRSRRPACRSRPRGVSPRASAIGAVGAQPVDTRRQAVPRRPVAVAASTASRDVHVAWRLPCS